VADKAAARIRVLDRVPLADPTVAGLCEPWPVGDVTDADAVRRACAGIDTVFHLASYILLFPVLTAELRRVNVDGTANVVLPVAPARALCPP
jgi:nucleoside-diphosphate-sugar epimerase